MPDPRADVQPLLDRLLAGDPLACARALSWVEEMDARSDAVLAALFPRLGRAWRVGLAGPPGAGKSTLSLELARAWRARGWRVGVVAVDPTSPLSGGALLGDRIRLRDLATDPGVFIRSLASRGSLGGLSLAAGRVADVLDAFGCDVVLLETVGMGQVGDDVRHESDTAVVVLVPESGDGVQTMKAGILELADVLVVNKVDRPGASDLLRQLAARNGRQRGGPTAAELRHHGPLATPAVPPAPSAAPAPDEAEPLADGDVPSNAWDPPIVGTAAVRREGIAELVEAIDRHREWVAEGAAGRLAAPPEPVPEPGTAPPPGPAQGPWPTPASGPVPGGTRADPVFWRQRFHRLAEQRVLRALRARLDSVGDLDARLREVRGGRLPLERLLAELLGSFHRDQAARAGTGSERDVGPPSG